MNKIEIAREDFLEKAGKLAEAIRTDGIVPTHRVLFNIEIFMAAERELRKLEIERKISGGKQKG